MQRRVSSIRPALEDQKLASLDLTPHIGGIRIWLQKAFTFPSWKVRSDIVEHRVQERADTHALTAGRQLV